MAYQKWNYSCEIICRVTNEPNEAVFNRRTKDPPCVYLICCAWATGRANIRYAQGGSTKRKARRVGVWFFGESHIGVPKLDFGTKTFANKLNRISKVSPHTHTHKFKENIYFASFKLDFFWVYLQSFVYVINFPEFLLIFQAKLLHFLLWAQGWVSQHKVLGEVSPVPLNVLF